MVPLVALIILGVDAFYLPKRKGSTNENSESGPDNPAFTAGSEEREIQEKRAKSKLSEYIIRQKNRNGETELRIRTKYIKKI